MEALYNRRLKRRLERRRAAEHAQEIARTAAASGLSGVSCEKNNDSGSDYLLGGRLDASPGKKRNALHYQSFFCALLLFLWYKLYF